MRYCCLIAAATRRDVDAKYFYAACERKARATMMSSRHIYFECSYDFAAPTCHAVALPRVRARRYAPSHTFIDIVMRFMPLCLMPGLFAQRDARRVTRHAQRPMMRC